MKTIDLHAENKASVDDFIASVQALFPKHNVNIYNVNNFSLVAEERKNCISCKGLSECKNSDYGHCMAYENDEFVMRACRYKKEEAAKKNSLIKTEYIPRKILENATLENYELCCESRKKIFASIMDFTSKIGTEEYTKGLFLYGSFAKGKTFTLAVAANELAKKGVSSLLIYFPDLVIELKSSIGTSRFDDLINMLKSIDVLMLDDFGSENMTPWIRDEVLGPVLNYRMNEQKAMFITSNLNPDDLLTHLSIDQTNPSMAKAKRICSRFAAMMRFINIEDSKTYKR